MARRGPDDVRSFTDYLSGVSLGGGFILRTPDGQVAR